MVLLRRAALSASAAALAGFASNAQSPAQSSPGFESEVLRKLNTIEDALTARKWKADLEDSRRIAYAQHQLEKVLFTSTEIDQRVKELGERITQEYEGKELIVVGLLSGVFMFFGDLVRNVSVAHKVDFMVVSSYGMGSVSTSNVKIKKDMSMSVEGKHVSRLYFAFES